MYMYDKLTYRVYKLFIHKLQTPNIFAIHRNPAPLVRTLNSLQFILYSVR